MDELWTRLRSKQNKWIPEFTFLNSANSMRYRGAVRFRLSEQCMQVGRPYLCAGLLIWMVDWLARFGY